MGRLGELKQRAYSPLAAGLTSESKKDGKTHARIRMPLAQSPQLTIQTFGDLPYGFHHHLDILFSDSCFHVKGMFSVSLAFGIKALEQILRYKVLKMLLAKVKITRDMIIILDKWRHNRVYFKLNYPTSGLQA